jgi:CPA2 family monovalent cation:H+ antiporter-2
VLILVVLGPIAARYTEPLARRLTPSKPIGPTEAPAAEPGAATGAAAQRLDDTANTAG